MAGQLFAGVGLGLLVGMLVGLSSSPVVSVVVGALSAAIVTLLGFVSPEKAAEGPAQHQGSVVRLGSFGVACTLAILLGLFLRTHNWASPSISQQVEELQKAGYSADEARRWVAYKNVGATLEPASGSAARPTTGNNAPAASGRGDSGRSDSVAASVLFAGGNSGECQYFDTARYKDASEHLYSLRQSGGKYAEVAEKISTLDAPQQKMVLDSLRLLYCPR